MRTNADTGRKSNKDSGLALYPYQREAVAFLQKRGGNAGLFAEMGTGKTPIALHYLLEVDTERILVVCPLSVIGVWAREAKRWHMPFKVYPLSTGTNKRKALTVEHIRIDRIRRMVIVNYESFWREPLRSAILRYAPDAVVLDEAHRIKGRNTRQASFAHRLATLPHVKHRLALTGTPVMNGIEDLFSIYKFIDLNVFGSRWGDFDRRYVTRGGYGGYQIIGYRGLDEIKRKVNVTAFQISKADALSLPARIVQIVPVTLGPKTRSLYEQMKRNALIELDSSDGKGVSLSRIVLTTLLRLQQLTGGFIPLTLEEKTTIADVGDDKLRTALELTKDAVDSGEKVVIFCRYIHDIMRLKEALPKAGIISGSVDALRREKVLATLTSGKVKVLLVQISTGALGIDLTAASVSIFYSTGYSLGEFEQARARLHRHGQTKRVVEYHLQAENTVDEKIFQALTDKQQIARKVVSLDYAKGLLK